MYNNAQDQYIYPTIAPVLRLTSSQYMLTIQDCNGHEQYLDLVAYADACGNLTLTTGAICFASPQPRIFTIDTKQWIKNIQFVFEVADESYRGDTVKGVIRKNNMASQIVPVVLKSKAKLFVYGSTELVRPDTDIVVSSDGFSLIEFDLKHVLAIVQAEVVEVNDDVNFSYVDVDLHQEKYEDTPVPDFDGTFVAEQIEESIEEQGEDDFDEAEIVDERKDVQLFGSLFNDFKNEEVHRYFQKLEAKVMSEE